jgi:LysM repeat protein
MQSLKSTAFAVTLLAISFGLYCVSNNNAVPETELDPIEIDSSLSTSQRGSMTLPSFDSQSQQAPIQVSTNAAPALDSGNMPSLQSNSFPNQSNSFPSQSNSFPSQSNSFPELPTLQTPNLQPQDPQFTNSAPALETEPKQQSPLKLPSLSGTPNTTMRGNSLQLPEIATRQPVSTAPTNRDNGLIDALKTNNSKTQAGDNSFQARPTFSTTLPAGGANDQSFNSLATAVAKDNEEQPVSNADGVTELSSQAPSQASIANVWAEVDRLVAADQYRYALGVLSQHYTRKGLTGPQQQKLQGWLDALAGKVIYSTEHHFVSRPYVVTATDTLESIANQMKVPTEVIYNINRAQFSSSNEVKPGMELKVVNGPFHAEIDLKSKMMTLFVKNLYAGRFPVAVGISGDPKAGNFKVMAKSPNGFTWRDANGKEYPAGSPGNGYGPYWIGLTGSLCIHAVPSGTPHGHRGCIGMSEKDAKDVFGILSKDSQISIVR